MALYNQILPEFRRLHAQLLGSSVDGVWCHAAFTKDRNLHFPLLADFEPKGAVASKYGVYRQQDSVSERALFVISKGVIAWSYVSPVGVNPGADGILAALEDLTMTCAGILVAILTLSGCDPLVNVAGANFPAWLFCTLVGAALAMALRPVFVVTGLEPHIGPRLFIYPCLMVVLGSLAYLLFFGRT